MDLCYDVTNQKVTRNAKKFIVNRSQNYLRLVFDFKTDDWAGAKYCIFHYQGKDYRCLLDVNNSVTVPHIVLQGRSFRFTLYCTYTSDDEVVYVTGEEVTVHLRESGFVSEYDEDVLDDLDENIVDVLYGVIDGKSDKGHIHDDRYYTETETNTLLEGKANTSHTHTKSQITDFPTLATVATSGNYNDLSNKPSIPSKISDLTNDSDFIEKSSTSGLVKNDGTIDTNTYLTQHQSLTGYLQTTDIADNLTTNDASKVLSAKQGKLLKDLIGDAITYING